MVKISARECSDLGECVMDTANREPPQCTTLFGLKEKSEKKMKFQEHVKGRWCTDV